MIDIVTADQLLDFGARMGQGGEVRAREQLEGAVAIHNILENHGVAYLADEVGMGKTYVALGAMALFRHFQPDFRVLVIAPRQNIQAKWMKELRNFSASNIRFTDLRNRTIDGQPGRPLVACNNLMELVHEASVDPHRDFFARMSSFSLGLSDDAAARKALREKMFKAVPWLSQRERISVDQRNEQFKDDIAKALCCALPTFDLVIVDEAHNLKHGFTEHAAARNRVLALALGRPLSREQKAGFPGYTSRARRVLFLSATPLEGNYRQLWNQLDVFGRGGHFQELNRSELGEDGQKEVAKQFLVRRVTSIKVGGTDHTKNQYRREWRQGGVETHDTPVQVQDSRQRLVVALVQKKVAELLGSEKFGMSFQVGMLASFESFLETTRIKPKGDDQVSNFDDAEQTAVSEEREGIDVHDVNNLARRYRKKFGEELPHPKMDTLVRSLVDSWTRGAKALIFVRRVASVKELKNKLDHEYDRWLIATVRDGLPVEVHPRFNELVDKYRADKLATESYRKAIGDSKLSDGSPSDRSGLDDHGGQDTFFAWFFRGDGPKGVVSGANIQRRFIQKGTSYATFFEHNFVAELLEVPPGRVAEHLSLYLECSLEGLQARLRELAVRYLGRARKHTRGDRVEAFQAAAVELLKAHPGALADLASTVWHERFESSLKVSRPSVAPELGDELEVSTFFSELRRPEWSALRRRIWPAAESGTPRDRFREEQLRGQLLATAARLGHPLVDLYLLTIQRLGSLDLRTLDKDDAGEGLPADGAVHGFLALLEEQRCSDLASRRWGAFDELAQISEHFELLLSVNAPDARVTALAETARLFGSQLRQQQPVAGMSGQINATVIKQFRMPGYPFVLVTTDLLQEGEDLHTFCSKVIHYGISWTPSAMEQRIGRIDRVLSHTDRRLNGRDEVCTGEEMLQVYYPYLSDTVEVLQVNNVLARMNTFLRLMHEGLAPAVEGQRAINVSEEILKSQVAVEAITSRLETAFPIPTWAIDSSGPSRSLDQGIAATAQARFSALKDGLSQRLEIHWERDSADGRLLGTTTLPSGRIQPFALLLRSRGDRLVVRCVSPIGQVGARSEVEGVLEAVGPTRARVGAILTADVREYDLTVEDDVGLADPAFDSERVSLVVGRILETADAIEQHHFEHTDHTMPQFEATLRREGMDGYR